MWFRVARFNFFTAPGAMAVREAVKKLRKQLVREGERPREPLRVRVFPTTGSRERSPPYFFTASGPGVGGGIEAATHPGWLRDRCSSATAVAAPATPPERGFS